MDTTIDIARTEADIRDARALFGEYHEWLGAVICSTTLAEETANLPGPYAEPAGRLLVARGPDGLARGVVGVRHHEDGVAEIKRLYVRPDARGTRLGRRLMEEALAAAAELGYGSVRLTTLPASMDAAVTMYRSLGFVEVEPFFDHSHVVGQTDMLFMERRLG